MEALADPKQDRVVKDVEPPPAKPISDEVLYPNGSAVPDWRALKTHLFKEGRVTKETCLELVKKVCDITGSEPNLLRLKDPITVVGDIHGQFYDMCKMLDVGGDPDNTQYLFLGDYVDRGSFSIEVILVLFALKLNHPERIWFLRGNHECRQMTAFFNFRDECEYKYDLTVYYAFMEAFDTLPIAAVINGKFVAVHGGLSPDLRNLNQISTLNRICEPPRAGLFCDLLWADPVDEEKEEHREREEFAGGATVSGLSSSQSSDAFFANDVRGCSFCFGYKAACDFLQKNALLSIIRAHEAQLEGFKMHQTNAKTGFPTVITIFSAPNYCDCYNNKAAVLKFENNTLNIQQFNFSPHPYHLPNFMDVFTWSIPFVSEKVTEMLYAILTPGVEHSGEEDEEGEAEMKLPEEVQKIMSASSLDFVRGDDQRPRMTLEGRSSSSKLTTERKEALRKKVQSVARLMRVFKTLRIENELIVQLKGVTPGHRIPPGALLQGKEGLKNELDKFRSVKELDAANERRPDGGIAALSSSDVRGGGAAAVVVKGNAINGGER